MEMEIVVKTSKRQNSEQKSVLFANSLRSEFNRGTEIVSELDICYVSIARFSEVEPQAAQAIINIAEKYEIEKDLTCNFQYSVREGLKLGHEMEIIKNNFFKIVSNFDEYQNEQVIDEISIAFW